MKNVVVTGWTGVPVTSIYLASAPEVEGVTGEYFSRKRVATPSRHARDDDSARRLWELSEQLTGVSWP